MSNAGASLWIDQREAIWIDPSNQRSEFDKHDPMDDFYLFKNTASTIITGIEHHIDGIGLGFRRVWPQLRSRQLPVQATRFYFKLQQQENWDGIRSLLSAELANRPVPQGQSQGPDSLLTRRRNAARLRRADGENRR